MGRVSDSARVAVFFDRRAEVWDGIYSGLRPAPIRAWNRLLRRNVTVREAYALRAVPDWTGLRVLDAGCGSGRTCVELARRGAAEVVGIDVSAGILALAVGLAAAEGTARRCRFVCGDVVAFEDDTGYDAIVANGFFDYVRDPGPMLARLRLLGRGVLVASFPARWTWRMPLRRAWLAVQDCPLRLYGAAEIEDLCGRGGWRCTELLRSGPIYLLKAE